jgi:hypothetical protein
VLLFVPCRTHLEAQGVRHPDQAERLRKSQLGQLALCPHGKAHTRQTFHT